MGILETPCGCDAHSWTEAKKGRELFQVYLLAEEIRGLLSTTEEIGMTSSLQPRHSIAESVGRIEQ